MHAYFITASHALETNQIKIIVLAVVQESGPQNLGLCRTSGKRPDGCSVLPGYCCGMPYARIQEVPPRSIALQGGMWQ